MNILIEKQLAQILSEDQLKEVLAITSQIQTPMQKYLQTEKGKATKRLCNKNYHEAMKARPKTSDNVRDYLLWYAMNAESDCFKLRVIWEKYCDPTGPYRNQDRKPSVKACEFKRQLEDLKIPTVAKWKGVYGVIYRFDPEELTLLLN